MASQMETDLLAAVPATGAITFQALRAALTAAGKGKSIAAFHTARHAGTIAVSLQDGVLNVSRPGNIPASPVKP